MAFNNESSGIRYWHLHSGFSRITTKIFVSETDGLLIPDVCVYKYMYVCLCPYIYFIFCSGQI